MKTRSGISPFLATVVLVAITLMIGGVLYSEFRQVIVSQVRDPSLTLMGTDVAPDGETIVVSVKNDGNVPVAVSQLAVSYGAGTDSFVFGGNATLIASTSGTSSLQPGDTLTARVKTTFPIPAFSTFTLTVVGDQFARAFSVQA